MYTDLTEVAGWLGVHELASLIAPLLNMTRDEQRPEGPPNA